MPALRAPRAALPSSMSPKLLTLTAVAALVVAATACGTLGKHYGEENESTQVRPTNPVFEPVITTASILVDSVPSGAIIRMNGIKIGTGPVFAGPVFPFCFITIACGAISGFHALISSGTTPKMIDKESDIRPVGYGAMLVEGVVGLMALTAAASFHEAVVQALLERLHLLAPRAPAQGLGERRAVRHGGGGLRAREGRGRTPRGSWL